MARQPQSRDDEMLSRMRRMETRLTQMMVALNIPTHAQKPEWKVTEGAYATKGIKYGQVHIPSPHTSIQSILDTIPDDWNLAVDVYLGDEIIATLDPSAG